MLPRFLPPLVGEGTAFVGSILTTTSYLRREYRQLRTIKENFLCLCGISFWEVKQISSQRCATSPLPFFTSSKPNRCNSMLSKFKREGFPECTGNCQMGPTT